MKYLLFFTAGCLMFFVSCSRYSTCSDPRITLYYQVDTSDTLVCEFNTYEKGTGFSKLISSKTDSVYWDSVYSYYDSAYHPQLRAKYTSVDSKYDYIINIPETGKTYKISDISYGGNKSVKASGIISENKTGCSRSVSYTLNGKIFTVNGSTYEGQRRPDDVVIEITK
jgi:hypothetical protein